ncbi:MAG: DUF4160 domain-containing protein [Solirubrobacterales bacterium]|nr:DUF4160 domain-containing protein [Solirubrobacterales bacterium]
METGEVIRGGLPERALRLVREWASIHRGELDANWELIQIPDAPCRFRPCHDQRTHHDHARRAA